MPVANSAAGAPIQPLTRIQNVSPGVQLRYSERVGSGLMCKKFTVRLTVPDGRSKFEGLRVLR